MIVNTLRRFGLIGLIAFPLLALADDSILPRLVNPAGSDFTVSHVDAAMAEIQFSGQAWVTGTLNAEWAKNVSGADILVVSLEPGKGQIKRLPHIRDDAFDIIGIDSAEQGVKLAFDKGFAERLLGKQIRSATMHGNFLLKGYTIGECGSPWARAQIVSAKGQQAPTMGQGRQAGDC